jgi:flagellar protein FliT
MSIVKQLHEKTSRTYENIIRSSEGKNRDQVIIEITQFLDERDNIIGQIKQPFTEEEKKLGKELVKMDSKIQEYFQIIIGQIKGSIKQIQNQKRNNKRYVNPYQNVGTSDGMFFDKKN